MMRKFTRYLLISAFWLTVVSCNEEEVVTPPKPTFQADKSTAEVGEEITFTINEVNADAISLLPYGSPGGDAGVLLTKFTDGVVTVGFSYARPGTFKAIVVANNHSSNGENVKNVQSEPITITITSSENSISDFIFEKTTTVVVDGESEEVVSQISTETVIDENAKTIAVTVLHGSDPTKLRAKFTASEFSTVTIGGTVQTSGTTVNDFTSPKVYTVTADDGTASAYTVGVTVTPVETDNTIKSITAVAVSKSADEKELLAAVNNIARTIVVYDTMGTPSTQFDSVRIGYELDGEFALLKYGGKVMDQDSLLDLTSEPELDVYSQDSTTVGGIQTYTVYSAAAPKLALSFPGLNPDPAEGVKPTNFNLDIKVLKGTDRSSINTTRTTTAPVGVAVTGTKVDGAAFVNGAAIDYSEPVEFQLTVNDSNLGVIYIVTYTVTVTVIP